MYKLLLLILSFMLLNITPAMAADRVAAYIPDPRPVGAGRLSVFTLDVYDATLLARQGKWRPGDPLALELTYLRNLKGSKIADRSVVEMRHIGISDEVKLAAWHSEMRRIFPDVRKGFVLTGIRTPKGDTVFLSNGQEIGRIKDPDFGEAFFGIWLSERTSEPGLRRKLLGAS